MYNVCLCDVIYRKSIHELSSFSSITAYVLMPCCSDYKSQYSTIASIRHPDNSENHGMHEL